MTATPPGAKSQHQPVEETAPSPAASVGLPGVNPGNAGRFFRLHPFNKITVRLVLWATVLALLPIGILVSVSLNRAEKAIHDEAIRKLMMLAGDRHNRVEEDLRQIKLAVQNESLEPLVSRLLKPGNQSVIGDTGFLRSQLGEALRPLVGSDLEVFVANMQGQVIASINPDRVGMDCSHEEYFLRGRKSVYLSDVFPDSLSQRMIWMVSAPVIDEDNRSLMGVLVSRIDPYHLSNLVGDRWSGHGNDPGDPETEFRSRVYLVNRDGYLLTGAPLFPDSFAACRVESKPIRLARDSKKGMFGDYLDFKRTKVVGASEVIPDLGWVVLAETDYRDALAPYAHFRTAIVALALVVFALTLVLVLRLGTIIVRPLRDLLRAEERLVAGGELTAMVPDEHISDDDIGNLIRQRNVVIQRVLEAEKRHRDLVDEIDGIAWEAEVGTWRFTFVNRRGEQILGYPSEQWLSEPGFWVRHLHPLDRSRTVQAYLEASITGKDLRLEYRMLAADGHPVWLRDQAHLVSGSFMTDGRPIRQLRGLMIDITAAKQAQELLQESERRARTIIDMSHNAMIGIDSKGNVSVFNHAAEQMFQIPSREIIGQPMVRLVPEKYRERHAKGSEHYLETGRSSGFIGKPMELEGLRTDGSVFPIEITLTPTKDKAIRVIAVIQDITLRQKAAEELLQRYRQLEGIHQLTDALIHAESIQEIYTQAMSCAKLTLRADNASIVLSDPDGTMRFRAWTGLSERYRTGMEGRMPWSAGDTHPRPLLVSDVHSLIEQGAAQPTILTRSDLEELKPIFLNEGIIALCAVPLFYQGRLLGRLMVYFREPHEFTDPEIQFGQTIAAHVAFAIGRQRANDVLKTIVEGASPSTGTEFFHTLVRHLAEALHTRWAFIGESLSVGTDKIRTLALWSGEDFAENIEYDLAGTPCEGVMGRAMSCYPKGVAPMFPQDPLLVEMGVESYLGVRLSDSAGKSLGILVVMHDAPLSEPAEAESILSVFAARASAELERVHAEQLLNAEKQWYADMASQIGEAFMICDADSGQIREASGALQTLLGYSLSELKQTTIHTLSADDRASTDRYLRSHVEGQHFTLAPARFRTRSGLVIIVEASTSLFESEQKQFLFVVVRGAERMERKSIQTGQRGALVPTGAV